MSQAFSDPGFLGFLMGGGLMLLILALVGFFSVPPQLPEAPEILAFDYSPKPAAPGEDLLFTWKTVDAVCVLLHGSSAAESIQVPHSGTLAVKLRPDSTWTLTAIGSKGERVTDSVSIARVNGWNPAEESTAMRTRRGLTAGLLALFVALAGTGCGGTTRELVQPRILTFRADPPEVSNGLPTTLQWTATGAARATMEPGGDVTGKASLKVLPDASQSYVLTVWSADGLVDRGRVDVTVLYHQAAAPKEGGER